MSYFKIILGLPSQRAIYLFFKVLKVLDYKLNNIYVQYKYNIINSGKVKNFIF